MALAACAPGTTDGGTDGGAAHLGRQQQRAGAAGTYLALGDSVPFGYIGDNPDGYEDEDAFVGYPELIARGRGPRRGQR